MYNHYQSGHDYVAIEPEDAASPPPNRREERGKSQLMDEVGGGITRLLTGISNHLKLEHFDTGDILLILIILFLFLEGDNLELIITLGLMLLLGLSED